MDLDKGVLEVAKRCDRKLRGCGLLLFDLASLHGLLQALTTGLGRCTDVAKGGSLITPCSSLGKFVFGRTWIWKGELELLVRMAGKEGSTVFLLSIL